jgi:imidazolonepropionase-like amidohydrolase
MDTDRLLVDQTLLIEDGRIVAMGPSAGFELPPDSAVVEGKGKYLMPGLADMHVHFSSPGDAVLFLAHGVTMVRNMAGAPFHLAFQHHVLQHKFPGPFMVTTSPLLEGAPPVLPTWKVVTHPDEVEPIVQSYVKRGYQQIKVYNLIQPEVLSALGQAATALGMRVVGHCPDAMTFEEAVAAGMTCFEHLTGIWRGHLKEGLWQQPGQPNLALDVLQMTIHHLDLGLFGDWLIRWLQSRSGIAPPWLPTSGCMFHNRRV